MLEKCEIADSPNLVVFIEICIWGGTLGSISTKLDSIEKAHANSLHTPPFELHFDDSIREEDEVLGDPFAKSGHPKEKYASHHAHTDAALSSLFLWAKTSAQTAATIIAIHHIVA